MKERKREESISEKKERKIAKKKNRKKRNHDRKKRKRKKARKHKKRTKEKENMTEKKHSHQISESGLMLHSEMLFPFNTDERLHYLTSALIQSSVEPHYWTDQYQYIR